RGATDPEAFVTATRYHLAVATVAALSAVFPSHASRSTPVLITLNRWRAPLETPTLNRCLFEASDDTRRSAAIVPGPNANPSAPRRSVILSLVPLNVRATGSRRSR